MKNFLKGLFLGMGLFVCMGVSSAYASRDNALRQEAKHIYQEIQQAATENNSWVSWNLRGFRIKDHDYEYTDEIPAILCNFLCDIQNDDNEFNDTIGVLCFSGSCPVLCSLKQMIIKGVPYAVRFKSSYYIRRVKDVVEERGSSLLLLVDDRLKAFMREKDPDWNPELFKLSEI